MKLRCCGKDPADGSLLLAYKPHPVWAEGFCADKARLDAAVLLVGVAHCLSGFIKD